MEKLSILLGKCLCGAVEVSANQVGPEVGACHCSTCRRWGGGPLLTIDCGSDVHFKGENNIVSYQSSEWARRGFCRQCGTHLFYHLVANDQYVLPVGLFGDQANLHFDHQIFVDEKPPYYDFANSTKNMTGAEVFALYGASK